MKISDLLSGQPLNPLSNNPDAAQKRSVEQKADNAQQTDKVTISDEARRFSLYQRMLDESESQQKEKVASIKERFNAGTYNVDSRQVAASIMSYIQQHQLKTTDS